MRERSRFSWMAWLGLVVMMTACGRAGESPAPATQADEAAPEPATLAEAESQLERAKRELGISDAYAAAPPPPPPPASPASRAEESTSAPPAPKAAPQPQQQRESVIVMSEGVSKSSEPVNPCAMPCRAIASMRRAVQAICRLAGDADERCGAARRTLDASEQRVASCRCR